MTPGMKPAEQPDTLQEFLKKSLGEGQDLRRRFEQVVTFPPLSDNVRHQLAGLLAGKEWDDKDLSKEQQTELGAVLMEVIERQEGYNPDAGARGLRDALLKALAAPLESAVEQRICQLSQVYAGRVSRRNGSELAEALTQGATVQPMKRLQFKRNPGATL
jgi:ATP-dependent Clp protease ATP-binding subunit ClpA